MRLDFVYIAAAGEKGVAVGGANTLYTEGDLRVAAASINTVVLDTVMESSLVRESRPSEVRAACIGNIY